MPGCFPQDYTNDDLSRAYARKLINLAGSHAFLKAIMKDLLAIGLSFDVQVSIQRLLLLS